MQVSSKLLFRTAIVLLGLLLVTGLIVVSTSVNKADAYTQSQWEYLAGNINGYVSSQIDQYSSQGNGFDDGEGGFVRNSKVGTGPADPDWSKGLKGQLDSNNDGTYLGEGDDAAKVPVMVDVYTSDTKWIPGTMVRVGNTLSGQQTYVDSVKTQINNHRDAGFSTDLVFYCLTGHTESPPVMAYGAMSAAGYFDDAAHANGDVNPNVYGLRWGRAGWGTTQSASYASPVNEAVTGFAADGNSTSTIGSDCTSAGNTPEAVRCRAQTALTQVNAGVRANNAAGGAVWSYATHFPVDLREGTPAYTMGNGGAAISVHDPLRDLFSSTGSFANLKKLPVASGTTKNVFVNRSQHTAAMAALGAQMLYYPSDYMRWGLPSWNNANPPGWYNTEHYTGPAVSCAGNSCYWTAMDSVAPVASAPVATAGTSTANIAWNTTGDPSTTVVEIATTSGGPYTKVNTGCDSGGTSEACSVLRGSHSITLTGLSEGTQYYYRISSYDGSANGQTYGEYAFTTGTSCAAGKPSLTLSLPNAYWASMADYTARILSVDWTINNVGTTNASNVVLTGSTPNGTVTVNSGIPASIGTIVAGGTGTATVKYNIPAGYGGFHVWNTASADDCAGNPYTYPV